MSNDTCANFGRRRLLRLLGSTPCAAVAAGALSPLLLPREAHAARPPHGALVWSDEFDRFDPAKWRKGPDSWSDRYGTIAGWDPNLVTVVNSKLRLKVERRGSQWYGGLVHGRNLAAWKYGYFEIKAKVPSGQGLWSALWMMPTDNVYGYWPRSGEIDILEHLGRPQEVSRAFSTIHYATNASGAHAQTFRMATGTDWSQAYHRWGCLWTRTGGRESLKFYVDDVHYGTIDETQWPAVPGKPAGSPFDQRFYFILNLTVGGPWAWEPTPECDGKMLLVDWVRVFAPA